MATCNRITRYLGAPSVISYFYAATSLLRYDRPPHWYLTLLVFALIAAGLFVALMTARAWMWK